VVEEGEPSAGAEVSADDVLDEETKKLLWFSPEEATE